jgi:ABC-type spermidine/putrescine transport system permease subunit II
VASSWAVRIGKCSFGIYCGLVLLFLAAPVVIVIPLAFSSADFLRFPPPSYSLRWFNNFFSRRDWMEAAVNSLKIGFLTAGLATALGTAAAYGLVRGRTKGKDGLYAFLISPMIVPNIVFALALYYLFSKLRMVGNMWSLVLGHTVLALPPVIIVLSASLQSVDYALEQAAMIHGARRLRVFSEVTLPLILPGVITAALFAFLVSFDDLLIALFLSGSSAVTLPKRMWDGVRLEIDPTVAAVALLVMSLSTFVLVTSALLKTRAVGRADVKETHGRS